MPTKFEIMRRNRPKMARARVIRIETIRERIDRIESEMEAEWEASAEDEMAEIRAHIAVVAPQVPLVRRTPSKLRRVLFMFTLGLMGARA